MFTANSIFSDKTNAPQEALGTGCGGSFFPTITPALTEYKLGLNGCVGCSKSDDHGPPCSGLAIEIPFNEDSRERVPEAERITAGQMVRVFAAASIVGYVVHGFVDFSLIFNVGMTANNGVNAWQYEIVSASGTTLTLRGRNPKRLQFTQSVPNPEWIPGVNARLLSEGITLAMPIGSEVRFLAPSVLENKVRPLVTKVNPPVTDTLDDVTFTIEVSHSIDNATEHFDGGLPNPAMWQCQVRYEASAPAAWPNCQAQREAQWVRKLVVYTVATLTTTPVQSLKNTSAANTRIVPYSAGPWFEGVALRVVLRKTGGETQILSKAQTDEILTVAQSGGGWVSTLDFTDYLEDLETADVTYWCEAVSGDSARQVWNGSCANSQRDFSGSYGMDGDYYCTAIDCDQRDNYKADCWQPNASRFTVGSRTGAGIDTNRMIMPPNDLVEGEWLSMMWTRASWMLIQAASGVPYSFLKRPSKGGTSVLEWMGGFNLTTGGGAFPFQERLAWSRGEIAGRIVQTTEDDGEDINLKFGAFVSGEEQTMGGVLKEGPLHDENDWSNRDNEVGTTMTESESVYPSGAVGNTGVYSGSHGGQRMGTRSRLSTASREVHVTNMRTDGDEDPNVGPSIRERFA